jgi:glycerol kinase
VMAPLAGLTRAESRVPTTLAWVTGESPTYALEGNILSSGATLAWTADLLTEGSVPDLIALAETVPDSGGVTLVPAFTGLGAPHWDREAHALISGLSQTSGRGQIARAAVDAVAHQICDIVDVIEQRNGPLAELRVDGGATASELLMQTQANLLGRRVQVADVAQVSALGAAKLGWQALGEGSSWPVEVRGRTFSPAIDPTARKEQRDHWAAEVSRARYAAGRERS